MPSSDDPGFLFPLLIESIALRVLRPDPVGWTPLRTATSTGEKIAQRSSFGKLMRFSGSMTRLRIWHRKRCAIAAYPRLIGRLPN